MPCRHVSRILSTYTVTLLLGLSASVAQADRYSSNGVPADLYEEIQVIQDQVTSLQQAVEGLTEYLEAETAGTGEAYSEICFNARLGVLANGSIAVRGNNALASGTGMDVYGLLDINAGIQGEGQAQLAKMLESGVDMTVRMCLNAGVTNVVGVQRANTPVMPPAGLDDILNATNVALANLYSEFPSLVAALPAGPESIDPGVDALTNAALGVDDFSASTLLNGNNWNDAINGLPGAAVLGERYSAIQSTFGDLFESNPCAYYEDLYTDIDGTLAAALQFNLSSSCAFYVNAGSNNGVLFNSLVTIYDNNAFGIGRISNILDSSNAQLNIINSTVNYNRSVLDGLEVRVEDILDALP